MGRLTDQTVLISGATSGLGYALAQRLAQEGCRLALCGRSSERLKKLLSELALPSDRVFSQAFDLCDHTAAADFARKAEATLGGIEILINNAGANLGKASTAEINLKSFAAMLDLNCTAQLALTQPIWAGMTARGRGRVMNILSSAVHYASPTLGGYTASKGAFAALTQVMRREGKPLGIHVTAVYPGGIDSPFRAVARPDYLKPATVAEALVGILNLPAEAAVHEYVLRPPVEDNFA